MFIDLVNAFYKGEGMNVVHTNLLKLAMFGIGMVGLFQQVSAMQPSSQSGKTKKDVFIMCIDQAWLGSYGVKGVDGIKETIRANYQEDFSPAVEFIDFNIPEGLREITEEDISVVVETAVNLAIKARTKLQEGNVHIVTCGPGGFLTAITSHLLAPKFAKTSDDDLDDAIESDVAKLLKGEYQLGRPEGVSWKSQVISDGYITHHAPQKVYEAMNDFVNSDKVEALETKLIKFNHSVLIPTMLAAIPGGAALALVAKSSVVQRAGIALGTCALNFIKSRLFPVVHQCTVHIIGKPEEGIDKIWDTDGATRTEYNFVVPPPKVDSRGCLPCRKLKKELDQHPRAKQILFAVVQNVGKIALTMALAGL